VAAVGGGIGIGRLNNLAMKPAIINSENEGMLKRWRIGSEEMAKIGEKAQLWLWRQHPQQRKTRGAEKALSKTRWRWHENKQQRLAEKRNSESGGANIKQKQRKPRRRRAAAAGAAWRSAAGNRPSKNGGSS
jgi:hypothetical protein